MRSSSRSGDRCCRQVGSGSLTRSSVVAGPLLRQVPGIGHHVFAPGDSEDCDVIEQQPVDLYLGDTGSEADDQEPTLPRQAAKAIVKRSPPTGSRAQSTP